MSENLYTHNKIRTRSGQYIDVVKIKPTDILAEDIAFGLARECRFGNHTQRFYSVAEHSIWCMNRGIELYPDDAALHLKLLLHDAHEAYLGDWCTPMVDSIDSLYPGVKDAINVVKKMVQRAINDRFGISCPMDDNRVKEIDRQALEWEFDMKVCAWSGFPPMNDAAVADMWLTYFKKLVKTPAYIAA